MPKNTQQTYEMLIPTKSKKCTNGVLGDLQGTGFSFSHTVF